MTTYVPSLIIHGGAEDWNVLRPKRLTALLINGCIREWSADPSVLSNLNQAYNIDITTIIIAKYEWLYSLYYSLEQLQSLKVGDEVDYRMDNGKYVLANIHSINNTTYNLKSTKHNAVNDEYGYPTEFTIDYASAFKKQPKRFAKPNVISARTGFESFRFQSPGTLCNNEIFVNPPNHKGWKLGRVRKYDEATYRDHSTETYSKQILIQYAHNDQSFEFWTHLDDHEEITQWFLEPKEWEIGFEEKTNEKLISKSYGPFTAGQIKFIYSNNRYGLFRSGLLECKGEMKIKNVKDDSWTPVDEVGIYLLMTKHSNLFQIEKNCIGLYVKNIIEQKKHYWIYRLGSYGQRLSDLYLQTEATDLIKRQRWGQKTGGIYIKRIGEKGWYESNDIDLKILFYHLDLHPEVIIPLGINNIAERIEKAHTQPLRPYFKYDEWYWIEQLMKAMDEGSFCKQLRDYYSNSSTLNNINDVINDLERFTMAGQSDDFKHANDSDIANHFSKIISDNEKCTKVLYIIYDACKLLPVFKVWTDTFHENYLEKWFSYTRCKDHQIECCPIVQRMVGLDLFIHIFNKEITHIPDNINKCPPYWITLAALLSVLPHYSMERLTNDWKHLHDCVTSSVTQRMSLGDGHDDDDDDTDDEHINEVGKVDSSKIFLFFENHSTNCQIKCFVEDCHTMNRKCFPPRSHPPYPFPFEWDYQDKRVRTEYKIIEKLDSLHNMMHHIPLYMASTAKLKVTLLDEKVKLMNEMEHKTLKLFIARRRAANEKYKGIIDHPKRYYWEDNVLGWEGVQNSEWVPANSIQKGNAQFIKQKIKESQQEIACKSFEELDTCLDRYYKKCGRNNYFNEDKEGKFSVWAEDNGFEIEDIMEELHADVDDCASVEFDCDDNGVNNFPLLEEVSDETDRLKKIMDVINRSIKDTQAFTSDKENDYDPLYFALQLLHK